MSASVYLNKFCLILKCVHACVCMFSLVALTSHGNLEWQTTSANQRPWIANNTGEHGQWTGSKFSFDKQVCVKVLHGCKQHGKECTCTWGLCKSDLQYPEQQIGGVSFIPSPKHCNNETCIRWNKVCSQLQERWQQKQRQLGLSLLCLYEGQCFDLSVLFLFFSMCMWWFFVVKLLRMHGTEIKLLYTHDCSRCGIYLVASSKLIITGPTALV